MHAAFLYELWLGATWGAPLLDILVVPGGPKLVFTIYLGTSTVPVVDRRLSGSLALCVVSGILCEKIGAHALPIGTLEEPLKRKK